MRTLTALILTAALAVPSFAQQPQRQRQPGGGAFGGMFAGLGGGAMLLRSEDVQKDLKLTDEQKTKYKEFQEKQTKARSEAFPQGERPDPEKAREFRTKSQEETTKFLKDTLTEEQNKRLKQISFQQSLKGNPAGAFFTFTFNRDTGPQLGDPTEAGKALKFTDEQKDKIKSITEQMQKDMRELFGGGGGGGFQRPSPETQKKMEALTKESSEKIMEVLTDEQRKTLKDLQGEEFKGKIDGGFGGGGRRPGAGGAAGGGNGRQGAGAGAGGQGQGRRNRPGAGGAGAGNNNTEPKKDDKKDGDKKDGDK